MSIFELEKVKEEIKNLQAGIACQEISLKKLELSHYAALVEAGKWGERVALAQQNQKIALSLAAMQREHEYIQSAETLKAQIDQCAASLAKSKTKLNHLKSSLEEKKRRDSIERALISPEPLQSFSEPQDKFTLDAIKGLEQKLDQIQTLLTAAFQELAVIKGQFSISPIQPTNSSIMPKDSIDAELEALKTQLDQL